VTGAADPAVEPRFASAALLTIDTQLDTLDGGPLEIAGTSAALPDIRALCAAFRAAARPIVHVVRLYRADGSNAEPHRRALVSGDVPVLRPGTPGRLLAPGLAPHEGVDLEDELLLAGELQAVGPHEVVMYKPRWGAFFATPLDEHLGALGVDTVVVCSQSGALPGTRFWKNDGPPAPSGNRSSSTGRPPMTRISGPATRR